jgi:hypothetical protein
VRASTGVRMRYYVPVGGGGVFFRFGMTLIRVIGSLHYWRASRRRAAVSRMSSARLRVGPERSHEIARLEVTPAQVHEANRSRAAQAPNADAARPIVSRASVRTAPAGAAQSMRRL